MPQALDCTCLSLQLVEDAVAGAWVCLMCCKQCAVLRAWHKQWFFLWHSVEASRTIAEATQLFKITVSFGSVTSLISLPCYMSHASIPAAVRASRGLPDDLIRVSVGIEDPADLLAGRPLRMSEIWST